MKKSIVLYMIAALCLVSTSSHCAFIRIVGDLGKVSYSLFSKLPFLPQDNDYPVQKEAKVRRLIRVGARVACLGVVAIRAFIFNKIARKGCQFVSPCTTDFPLYRVMQGAVLGESVSHFFKVTPLFCKLFQTSRAIFLLESIDSGFVKLQSGELRTGKELADLYDKAKRISLYRELLVTSSRSRALDNAQVVEEYTEELVQKYELQQKYGSAPLNFLVQGPGEHAGQYQLAEATDG